MKTKFVEAGQGPGGGNWGTFMIGCYDLKELNEKPQYPGRETEQRLTSLQGWAGAFFWVFDLATGEAIRCHLPQRPEIDAHAELEEHTVLVGPLFEPMLHWLFQFIHEHPYTWFDTLPRTIDLPDAPFSMYGYRRTGTCALSDKPAG